jgi:hypothetical protein
MAISARWYRSIATPIADCLRRNLPRIVHGVISQSLLGHRLWLTGSLGWSEFRRCQKIENPLERDWMFKQASGFPGRNADTRDLLVASRVINASRFIY